MKTNFGIDSTEARASGLAEFNPLIGQAGTERQLSADHGFAYQF
jgi:outer membrane scaffolding protein for murein synthesis (MipA/OmpV family)